MNIINLYINSETKFLLIFYYYNFLNKLINFSMFIKLFDLYGTFINKDNQVFPSHK
jgi:hypothetical protein